MVSLSIYTVKLSPSIPKMIQKGRLAGKDIIKINKSMNPLCLLTGLKHETRSDFDNMFTIIPCWLKHPGNKKWFHLDGIFLGICEQKAINSWGSRSISNQSKSLGPTNPPPKNKNTCTMGIKKKILPIPASTF